MKTRIPLTFVFAAVPALGTTGVAQFKTSPTGQAAAEGNHQLEFFHTSTMRWQHIDRSQGAGQIPRLRLRPDAARWRSNPSTARVISLTTRMSNAATSPSIVFANNISGPQVTVFAGSLNLPAWAPGFATTTPAAFTDVIPFRFPYLHRGVRDLLIDLRWTANSNPGFRRYDAYDGTYVQGRTGKILPGCFPLPPVSLTGEICNYRAGARDDRADLHIRYADGGTSGVLALSTANPLSVPICICPPRCMPGGGLHLNPALPFVLLGLQTDPTGGWDYRNTTPIQPSWINQKLRLQGIVSKNSQPTLTNFAELTFPGPPTTGTKSWTFFDPNLAATTAGNRFEGSLIFRLD